MIRRSRPFRRRALNIALLTHSTNPRGGVVHCLELAEALIALGHQVTLHAPVAPGGGLFRSTSARVCLIPEAPAAGTLRERIERRIDTFRNWFSSPCHADFDLFHAHDGIGANALFELRKDGRIPGYVRTVHHLEDSYGDAHLDALEMSSILGADRLLCVSPSWSGKLLGRTGREAAVVGNGVNLARFGARPSARDEPLRRRLGLGPGPVFLAVGGIEARKNTVATLQAFARLRQTLATAQLVVAGGASLLDHSACRQAFDAVLAQEGLACAGPGEAHSPGAPATPVILAGVLEDADMPALYRCADALVFPSRVEGFGLAVIEAMACGIPAVVSRIPPFTDFLGDADCLWADPADPESIARAMCRALMPGTRERLAARGAEVAHRHDWAGCARAHVQAYRSLLDELSASISPLAEINHA